MSFCPKWGPPTAGHAQQVHLALTNKDDESKSNFTTLIGLFPIALKVVDPKQAEPWNM